ncbi:hypothetical protein FHS56_001536 [Thermonema lapsum]|uniref:Predicted 3'-5' exonuclease PolB-like domain-containing protein n=1 Tax=Thermonema lapsum TaxID=28195 RepID=A0A846MR36_9BACT|nr:ribonuclease H-like domain-containing protein [Thermonema lapsum]NIK74023.1 hypothetical protein [Thermonema lapsum]
MALFHSLDDLCSKVLFFDIETAPAFPSFDAMPPALQDQWCHQAEKINRYEDTGMSAEELYPLKAGIYAEFARVVCVSFGLFGKKEGHYFFRLKSYCGEDEARLLQEFARILDNKSIRYLCAHNGREFDVPFLARRYLIQGLPVPAMIDLRMKRPWDEAARYVIDTMELWSFGDKKSFTRLELLCAVFDIPSPKSDIDGSKVGEVFWKEKDLERIARYCENDVLATARLYLKYMRLPSISSEQVEYADRLMV